MRLRRGALALVLATAVTVPAVGTVAVAAAAKPSAGNSAVAKKPAGKPSKKIKFSATGTVVAVDAVSGTVTVKVKGGTKEVRGTTVDVTVPATLRVLINGAKKKVGDLAAGYSVTITGTKAGTVLTADKVVARKVTAKPAPTVTPSPSDDPSAEPDEPAEPAEPYEPSETPGS